MAIERTIRGIKFQINVDSSGTFHAQFQDRTISDVTLAALEQKLTTATREAVKGINIPFIRFTWEPRGSDSEFRSSMYRRGDEPPRIRRGVVVGFDVHQRALQVHWMDKRYDRGVRSDTLERWHSSSGHKDVQFDAPDQGIEKLQKLVDAYDQSRAILVAYLTEHEIDLQKRWDEEIKEL